MRLRGAWLAVPTGCRFVGWVDPPRRQGTGGELLDGVESGNHARGGVDLQRDRSLNEGLASPRTNFQMMLHITLILAIDTGPLSTPAFHSVLSRSEGLSGHHDDLDLIHVPPADFKIRCATHLFAFPVSSPPN